MTTHPVGMNPEKHPKYCGTVLPQLRSEVMTQQWGGETRQKLHPWRSSKAQTSADHKEQQRLVAELVSTLSRALLLDKSVRCAPHLLECLKQTHTSGNVMVWGWFDPSKTWTNWRNESNREFWSLRQNQVIIFWRKLGLCSRNMIWRTHSMSTSELLKKINKYMKVFEWPSQSLKLRCFGVTSDRSCMLLSTPVRN